MAAPTLKSRTFAVLIRRGLTLDVVFITRLTENGGQKRLEIKTVRGWMTSQEGQVVNLLCKAGLTVRHYDPEEKQWMDSSERVGTKRVSGQRDGTWGTPDMKEFEEQYLAVT